MATEGQVAIGPNGERAVYRGGQWVVVPAQQQMPADPTFPFQGAQAQAQAANTGAQAQVNQATVPAQITAANADATAKTRTAQTAGLPEGFMWGPDGKTAVPIPGYTRQGLSPEVRQNAIQAYTDADALERAADELEGLYRTGPGATKGFKGLQDYLPTDTNKVFDDAGQQARGYIKRALGFTGGEGNTVAESSALYDPYLPRASDRDAQIERKIGKLRELAQDARQKAVTTLGGIPDGSGSIVPVQQDRPNALAMPRVINEDVIEAAGAGATTTLEKLPPAYQRAYEAFARAGGYTPEQYADFRASLDRQFFPDAAPDRATYIEEGRRILDTLEKGGTLNLTVPGVERELSNEGLFGTSAFSEQSRNNAINNPVGAALAGAGDMASFGALIDPNAMTALSDAQPVGTTFGQMAGAIGGTGMFGGAARLAAGRLAPRLLRGGSPAAIARSAGTDAGYSGVYAHNTGQDPLDMAALGALGSLGGQFVGSAVGRGVSGVTSSPTVSRLYQQGVIPTLGQIARGRAADNGGRSFVAGVEDVLANNGAFGTLVNSARGRALEQGNQAAFNIGAQGRPITAIGERGLDQLDTAVDTAFGDALGGVRLDPRNPQFISDVTAADTAGRAVDAARNRGDFGYIMDNQLAPIFGGPEITGNQLQDALRLLRGQARAYQRAATGVQPDPMAAGVADATNEVAGALTDLAGDTDPTIVPRLNEANQMYRNLLVLDDASARAMNEGGVFTGAQLGQAIKANNRALGRKGLRAASESPFYQLQQDMQTVLPNEVPPTGVNAAPMLAMLGAASSAGGLATDNDYLKYAGLAGLSALPYTRAGQGAVASALLDRSTRAVAIGNAIRNRRGIFGSAAVPLLIAP